jgi:hypothetical protein
MTTCNAPSTKMSSEKERRMSNISDNCVDDGELDSYALDTIFDLCEVSITRTSSQEITFQNSIATIGPLAIFSLVSTMFIILCVSVQQDDGRLLKNLSGGYQCLLFLIFPLVQVVTAVYFADTDTRFNHKKDIGVVSLRSFGMIAWLCICFILMLKDEL